MMFCSQQRIFNTQGNYKLKNTGEKYEDEEWKLKVEEA